MAIMDYRAEFSDNLTLATTVATTYSNLIDLGAANPNSGAGEPIYVCARLTQAPVAKQALTSKLAITLEHSHSTTSASFATLQTIQAASVAASFTVNTFEMNQALPASCRRYLRIAYATSGTGWTTAPKFDAWMSLHAGA